MNKKFYIIVLIIFVFSLIWPYLGPQYQVYLSLSYLSYSVALLGFNLLFSYSGLLSMGHAMFIGFGGYSAAFLTSRFQVPYIEASIIAAILISAMIGYAVGLVCVRYTKIYFAMLTLAFGMLFYSFLLKSYKLTGGDEGMPISQPYLLGMDFS